MLSDGKCLLVVDDRTEKVSIFVQPLDTIGGAVTRGIPLKTLNHERVGNHPLMAFDEAKRLLSVVSVSNVRAFQPPLRIVDITD